MIVWLSRGLLDAMHHTLVEQYSGVHGVRDDGLVESALARPQNLFAYRPESDIASLAASLCFGLAKNHGYHDGNKRTAFTASAVFLELNGAILEVSEPDAVAAMVYLATDAWSETQLAEWLRSGTRAQSSSPRSSE